MEKLLEIKKEIQEKKGRVWLGLPTYAEKSLDDLCGYLDIPELHKNHALVEEIIKLYKYSKATDFTKVEGIIRKLDQLHIKFGDVLAEKERMKMGTSASIVYNEEPTCKSCGNVNRITAKFCDNCGTKL